MVFQPCGQPWQPLSSFNFNPVAFQVGPLAIHWYGLMYLGGFLGGWLAGEYRRLKGRFPVSRDAYSDLIFYAMMGVVIGGRVGYMLFYTPINWIWHDPLALVRIWDGGMSFHGGLLGVAAANWWWSRRHGLHFFDTVDFIAPLVPIGLGLGRLGNFINGELWGKPSDVPWAMVFPNAPDVLAAPSLAALRIRARRRGDVHGAVDLLDEAAAALCGGGHVRPALRVLSASSWSSSGCPMPSWVTWPSAG